MPCGILLIKHWKPIPAELIMFHSLKARVLALIAAIMFVTAGILMLVTKTDVGSRMLESEEKSIRNAMFLINLNVENQYGTMLFAKMSTLMKSKQKMKEIGVLSAYHMESLYRLYQRGEIPLEEAKKSSVDFIRRLGGSEFEMDGFLYDESNRVIADTDNKFVGKDLSFLNDIKGAPLLTSMAQRSQVEGDGFAAFVMSASDGSHPVDKIGYFSYLPSWRWMYVVTVSLDSLQDEFLKKKAMIIQELKSTVEKVKIGKTGYMFLFNGNKEILIHPFLSTEEFQALRDVKTGKPIADELIRMAGQGGARHESLIDMPSDGGPQVIEFYTDYFKALDWYIVACAKRAEVEMPARNLVMRQISLIALILAAAIVAAFFLLGRYSRHLQILTGYAKELPLHDFSVPEADASTLETLSARYKDEVGKLSEAFLFMEDALRKYIQDLKVTTAAKERIESELKIARDIQKSIVPKIFPPFPDRPEFDLYAVLDPALMVGGDFYNFFFLDDEHLFFAIGDVSGKGIPASLFMAVTQTLFRAAAGRDIAPCDVLRIANDRLSDGNDECMFATAFCGTLDVRTGAIEWANGGHNPPVVMKSDGRAEYLTMGVGIALGLMPDIEFPSGELTLEPGDTLFMYTDGVTEATDNAKELFSEERLIEDLIALGGQGVREVTEGIVQRIDEFCLDAPQADDITILTLKWKCPTGALEG